MPTRSHPFHKIEAGGYFIDNHPFLGLIRVNNEIDSALTTEKFTDLFRSEIRSLFGRQDARKCA
jgi:hypothetical protein